MIRSVDTKANKQINDNYLTVTLPIQGVFIIFVFMDIEINSNISSGGGVGRHWKYPIPDLEVGDTLKVTLEDGDNFNVQTLRNRVISCANQYKRLSDPTLRFQSWSEGDTAYLKRVE